MYSLLHFDKMSYVIKTNVHENPLLILFLMIGIIMSSGCTLYSNKSVRHQLIKFIFDEVVKQFDHLLKSKQIYNQVVQKYNQSTKSHLMEAFQAYVRHKMLEEASVRDHVVQLSTRVRNLSFGKLN